MSLVCGLLKRARGISLARDGDRVEYCERHADRVEQLIPPPAHLVDALAEEVRRLAGWRGRAADWWDRRRRCVVQSEREGTARLLLGGPGAELHWWVLPYCGGVLVDLTLLPGPGAAEAAEAILHASADVWDVLSEGAPAWRRVTSSVA
jgi:hypothetical protein